MNDKGWLSLIALEIGVLIAMFIYVGVKANQAIASAQQNPILSIFSGL